MKIQNKISMWTAIVFSATSLTALAVTPQEKIAAKVAQVAETKALEVRFAKADANADGKLTLDEATAGMPLVAKQFAKIDSDKKGYVTLDQVKAAMANGTLQPTAANIVATTAASAPAATAASAAAPVAPAK